VDKWIRETIRNTFSVSEKKNYTAAFFSAFNRESV